MTPRRCLFFGAGFGRTADWHQYDFHESAEQAASPTRGSTLIAPPVSICISIIPDSRESLVVLRVQRQLGRIRSCGLILHKLTIVDGKPWVKGVTRVERK